MRPVLRRHNARGGHGPMKQLPGLLVVLWCLASVAMAGPNAGGVLWVHDTGLAYSTDSPGSPGGPVPADCSGVDNQQDLQEIKTVWKVYAAFPAGSSPRLSVVSWGLAVSAVGGGYVSIDAGGCGLPNADGPGTDLATTRNGWPDTDGGMIEQIFPIRPRTAHGKPNGLPHTKLSSCHRERGAPPRAAPLKERVGSRPPHPRPAASNSRQRGAPS